jgi:hypothetical protein
VRTAREASGGDHGEWLVNPVPLRCALMKRDRTVIAIGLCCAAVATLLVVLSWPQRLPSCDAFRGSIDGTGGEECGDGLNAWTSQALAGAVIGCVLYVVAIAAIAVGMRRRPIENGPG